MLMSSTMSLGTSLQSLVDDSESRSSCSPSALLIAVSSALPADYPLDALETTPAFDSPKQPRHHPVAWPCRSHSREPCSPCGNRAAKDASIGVAALPSSAAGCWVLPAHPHHAVFHPSPLPIVRHPSYIHRHAASPAGGATSTGGRQTPTNRNTIQQKPQGMHAPSRNLRLKVLVSLALV